MFPKTVFFHIAYVCTRACVRVLCSEPNCAVVVVVVIVASGAAQIVTALKKHAPLVKAMAFVGQSAQSRGAKGISQKEQTAIIERFKAGGYV